MRSSLRRFEVEPEDADDALILRDPTSGGSGARTSLFPPRGMMRVVVTVVAVLSVVVAASALAAYFASRRSGGGPASPSSDDSGPTLAPDQMPRPAGVPASAKYTADWWCSPPRKNLPNCTEYSEDNACFTFTTCDYGRPAGTRVAAFAAGSCVAFVFVCVFRFVIFPKMFIYLYK